MSELVTGVISGLISGILASLIFYVVLFSVRPKIHISDKICLTRNEKGELIYQIKVVNKTRSMLFNVGYTLLFCKKSNNGVYNTQDIQPLKEPIKVIAEYDKNNDNAEYAVRLSFPVKNISDKDEWFEFSICASHSFSNTSACMRKIYKKDDVDIKEGMFETKESMRILSITVADESPKEKVIADHRP